MGNKKILMRYGDDDSSGYRVQSCRRGKLENRKNDNQKSRGNQQLSTAPHVGRSTATRMYGDYPSNKGTNDIKLSRKKEKILMKTRMKQRLEKYDIGEDILPEQDVEDCPSHVLGKKESRKHGPTSPSKFWELPPLDRSKEKSRNHFSDIRNDFEIFLQIDQEEVVPKTSVDSVSSALQDGVPSTIVSNKVQTASFASLVASPTILSESHQSVGDVELAVVADEVSILSRCGEVLYSIIFPSNQYTYNRYALGWNDESDEEDDEVIVPKAWFVQKFLNFVKGSKIGSDSVFDAYSKINTPHSHKVLAVVTKTFVKERFLRSSRLFLTSMIDQAVAPFSDRDQSYASAVIQAAYRRCSEDLKIQLDIIAILYESLTQYLDMMSGNDYREKNEDADVARLDNPIGLLSSERVEDKESEDFDRIVSYIDIFQNILIIEAKQLSDRETSAKWNPFVKLFIRLFRSDGRIRFVNSSLKVASLKVCLQLLLQLIQRCSDITKMLDLVLIELLRSWPKAAHEEHLFIDALVMVLSVHNLPSLDDSLEAVSVTLSFPKTRSAIERSIYRLSQTICSNHAGVAQHAITVVQLNELIDKYFVCNDEDTIFVVDLKAVFIGKIVNSLRSCESHWNQSVKSAASAALVLMNRYEQV